MQESTATSATTDPAIDWKIAILKLKEMAGMVYKVASYPDSRVGLA